MALTLYNIGIVAAISLGGFSYGFGLAVFIISIDSRALMGGHLVYAHPLTFIVANSSYTTIYLEPSMPSSLPEQAFGAITQGWLADWLGRKNALAIAAACAAIGGALTGFGLGMIICLVPLYITEVAPPSRRGLLSGCPVFSFGNGYLVCAWLSVGAHHAANITLQWRLPLVLACVAPLCLLIGLPFIPESPRFLDWIGEHEKAWKIIQRLHNDPSDPTAAFANAEYIQIILQVEYDKEEKAGYIQMFRKPSRRRRLLLVMFLLFASQSIGILGITNFIVLNFQSIGLEGDAPLIMLGTYSIIGTIAIVAALFLVDRVGRRTLILIRYPIVAAILIAEAVIQWKYVDTTDKLGNAACLIFIFLYIIAYHCVDAPSFVWAAEILPTTICAKGIRLTFFAYFVGAITYIAPAAIAFQNTKWGMFLLWAGLCIVSTIIVYIFIPETVRLPIEEIGALFGDEVVIHLTADGHRIVEEKDCDSAIASAYAGAAVAENGTTDKSGKDEKGFVEHNEVRGM